MKRDRDLFDILEFALIAGIAIFLSVLLFVATTPRLTESTIPLAVAAALIIVLVGGILTIKWVWNRAKTAYRRRRR